MAKTIPDKNRQRKITAKKIAPAGNRLPGYLLPLVIVVFAFILYGNTLNHFYALDDDIVTRANTFVQKGFNGIPEIFSKGFLYGFNRTNDQSYRPVSLLTLAVEVGIAGNNPRVHHLFNLLYYAIACVLVFLLLKRFFPHYPVIVPLLITLFFTAHPVHTENVANIKSRDEILNLLLFAATLLLLFRYIVTRKPAHLALSSFCYLCALLTKEQAITFIAIFPLALWIFTDQPLRRILLLLIPFAAAAALYMLLRISILDTVTFGEQMSVVNNALASAPDLPYRIATALLILGRYILLLIFPHPLSWDYSFNQIHITTFADPLVVASVVVMAALVIYALVTLPKRNPHSFSILLFFITMSVVSNLFLLIGATLGERFLLIPSLGICISIPLLVIRVTRTEYNPAALRNGRYFYVVMAGILLLCTLKTISRNPVWKNNQTLFESGVITSPNSTRTHASLGFEYFSRAQQSADPYDKQHYTTGARKAFLRSIDIMPRNNYALYNLGVLEYQSGNTGTALDLFRRALQADPKDQNSMNNLSAIFIEEGAYDSALVYMFRKLEFTPGDAMLLSNIGAIFQRKGEYPEAIRYLEQALEKDSGLKVAYDNLSGIYYRLGDTSKAAAVAARKKQFAP